MNRCLLASLFKSLGKDDHSAEIPSGADDLYAAALPIANRLCYPLQFYYDTEDGQQIYRLGVIKDIRKTAEGVYLFRCLSDDDKGCRVFIANRMTGVTAGTQGQVLQDMAALTAFAERFRIFHDQDYLDARQALHLLLLLAGADGKRHKQETGAIQEFVERFCQRRGEDAAQLQDYLHNTAVYYNVFVEAVDDLDRLSNEEVQDIVATAQKLVLADIALHPDEERFFRQVEKLLDQAA